MLKNFSTRSKETEIMDDLNNHPENLSEILEDIDRVNALLGGFTITLNAIKHLISNKPKPSYTVVDFGCANGRMLRFLAAYFRERTIKINLIGVDLNEKALEIAKNKSGDFPEIRYYKKNILDMDFKESDCDIVISTLTLHHFEDAQIKELIGHFFKIASIGLVINDLQRSAIAYYLFKLFSRIFIKTEVAKTDGLISIKRAFKKSELLNYARAIPTAKHQIKWKWAFRYVWTLEKTQH